MTSLTDAVSLIDEFFPEHYYTNKSKEPGLSPIAE